jgi:hypothetical protein
MTDPDNFLSRWSRKKRDAVDEPTPELPAVETTASATPPAEAPAEIPLEERAATLPESVFDPASLPSLDSIGAQTDIRAFLQAGVPPDLTRAALRRAWTADPLIRDFKGLQENDWDFNVPNSMFGFGELGPDFDLKRMLASVFGETPKEAISPPTAAEVNCKSALPSDRLTATDDPQMRDPVEVLPPVDDETIAALDDSNGQSTLDAESAGVVRRNADIASQDDEQSAVKLGKRARSHGSALPK